MSSQSSPGVNDSGGLAQAETPPEILNIQTKKKNLYIGLKVAKIAYSYSINYALRQIAAPTHLIAIGLRHRSAPME